MRRPARALVLLAATTVAVGCSRSERPAGLTSPAVVTPGQKAPRPAAPPRSPPLLPAAPASEPASAPAPMPDIFALPPAPGTLVTDAQGRRFPFNQALVTVAPGTSREEVDPIAASAGGRVVGQIVAANLYQLLLPTKSVEQLEVAMDGLRKQPKVKEVTPNFMRNPASRPR